MWYSVFFPARLFEENARPVLYLEKERKLRKKNEKRKENSNVLKKQELSCGEGGKRIFDLT